MVKCALFAGINQYLLYVEPIDVYIFPLWPANDVVKRNTAQIAQIAGMN